MVSSNDKKMPNGILEEQGIAHWVSVRETGVGLSLKLASLSSSSWAHAPLASNTESLSQNVAREVVFSLRGERMSETFQSVGDY